MFKHLIFFLLLTGCVFNVSHNALPPINDDECRRFEFPVLVGPTPPPLAAISKSTSSKEIDAIVVQHMRQVYLTQKANYNQYIKLKELYESKCKITPTPNSIRE